MASYIRGSIAGISLIFLSIAVLRQKVLSAGSAASTSTS